MSSELRFKSTKWYFRVKDRKRYAMVIDLRRCTGCHACTLACKTENLVPVGVWRSWVKEMEKGEYPNTKKYFLPRLCNHCDNPPCVAVCPTQATYKHEDGMILQRYQRCIGCRYCIMACPYGARFIHPVFGSKWGFGVIDKCTFCYHRLSRGMVPACVNACPTKARIFGDLNDPESEVSKLLAENEAQVLKPELGTKPMVFYIRPDESIMGRIKTSDDPEEILKHYGDTYSTESFSEVKEKGMLSRESIWIKELRERGLNLKKWRGEKDVGK